MQERTKREDFDEELIKEFASWAIKTKGMPHWEENRKEGIEKFGLTSTLRNRKVLY